MWHHIRASYKFLVLFFSLHRDSEWLFTDLTPLSVIKTEMDGFQIKILGLLVCSPQSVVFQKWVNSTVNASQPQIKISDFRNFCLAQSRKIRSPFGVALPQRTQATRSCQHESVWPSLVRRGFLQPAPVRENHRQGARRTDVVPQGSTTCRNTGGDSSNSVYAHCLLQISGTVWFSAWTRSEWYSAALPCCYRFTSAVH